ncbi:MAG: DUF4255 domain-containing protein [Leptolyngbya sp. SIO1D8]|nr:DUF4255 domain-containing protein [Leptolyngbya sp. SIO1D8]
MSNHLAIATVTATLQRLLQQSVQTSVEGARVSAARPDAQGANTPETGITLYLYHLRRNDAYGNADTPGRQRRAEIARRNQLAIDLYYVLSFYGDEGALEPHRLLGSTLQLFEDRCVLTRDMIRETLTDPGYSFLADSDLADQLEMMWFELLPLSTDELSKIWSVFFQTPHALTVCYKVTVVMIEGREPGQRALPVRDRRVGISPFGQQPMVEQVVAATGRYDPILTDSVIRIHGRTLAANVVQVRIGGVEVRPSQVTETDILVPLGAVPQSALKIGVQGLQVIHPPVQRRAMVGSQVERGATGSGLVTRASVYRGVESNVAPFVVRPTIRRLQLQQNPALEGDPRTANFEVTTDIPLQPGQRAIISLNERNIEAPNAYVFECDRIDETTATLTFQAELLQPGEYLVRLQVDGAESVLQVDQNPQSPTFEQYVGPVCTIT